LRIFYHLVEKLKHRLSHKSTPAQTSFNREKSLANGRHPTKPLLEETEKLRFRRDPPQAAVRVTISFQIESRAVSNSGQDCMEAGSTDKSLHGSSSH
jgi:hypothetical protein